MKCMWQICVLWVFWVLILCLMVPCLDQKPDSAPQEKVMDLVPRRGNCLWFKFRKCGCPPETLNDSLCHHTARGQNWFDACYEKTMGYLGMDSASELGKMWEKLFKVIPRPSVSHNNLYCRTCVLVGNSKILPASGVSNNVTQHTTVFGMNQAPIQSFKTVGNQTRGRSTCRRNVGDQGYWRQLLLLVLKLSGLAWTSDALSQEVKILEEDLVP
ncbi:uncharacterized protein C20orf173 homolog isoform X3 [Eptesicus fuscus]|uniref:uncharacterized protein C20orf173 homolog isoform X3 n=1 Tax=Eptesicus fuscus TaxID=29078 RepID=UPI0024048BD2|nr:uncharacterized protein C20orf173 homolog isoform X3 [Eptesicus fuscus]